jgi:hypothetical protein
MRCWAFDSIADLEKQSSGNEVFYTRLANPSNATSKLLHK